MELSTANACRIYWSCLDDSPKHKHMLQKNFRRLLECHTSTPKKVQTPKDLESPLESGGSAKKGKPPHSLLTNVHIS